MGSSPPSAPEKGTPKGAFPGRQDSMASASPRMVLPPEKRRQATVQRTGTVFAKDGFPGCSAPKPPLCKGRWAGESLLGGVVNPSVSFAASSLYTRELFQLSNIAQHHRLLPVVSKCALSREMPNLFCLALSGKEEDSCSYSNICIP